MKKIIIAIDGYAGCGKSTLARQLAKKLNYVFLDTGAMYRAVTLFLLRNKVNWQNPEVLLQALGKIRIYMATDAEGRTQTWLNGELVEEAIRGMEVSNSVSEVAAVSAVRKFLVEQQQAMGRNRGIVMDGRDIGTVVFPQAELKLFVTASMDIRVQRRLSELQNKGIAVQAEEIRRNLEKRDHEETTRADSPLQKAEDAIVLDNSQMTPEQQLECAWQLAHQRIDG